MLRAKITTARANFRCAQMAAISMVAVVASTSAPAIAQDAQEDAALEEPLGQPITVSGSRLREEARWPHLC